MYMVGLTVSRGPLLGVALAAAVAFRPLLKRGFLPVLLVLALAWAFVAAGMFDGIIASYAERGAEETGRGIVWPAAFARFIEAPLFGVGVSNVFTLLPSGRNVSPHNALLWVALASGAIPALLFVVFWTRALRVALRAYLVGAADPYLLPLMVFALLEVVVLDTAFMSSWHLVVFCRCVATGMHVSPVIRRRARTASGLPVPAHT